MADHAANAETFRLEVRRTIPRPVAEVYAAWTTADAIAQWMAMPGCEQVKVQCEARAGGRLVIDLVHQGKPWREDGTWLEVVPNRRLRFTWVTPETPAAVNSVVTVEFTDRGASTDLTLTHTGFPNQQERDSHDAGWQQIVDVIIAAAKAGLTVATLARAALELQRASRA
ncbi:MAG TPA: SRPBCC family protein [Gemmatimonadales bacterium]|jgi:glutathione S-transferase